MFHLAPHQSGLSMPAEWEPHAATWTAWPRDDDYWSGALEGARQDLVRFLRAVAGREKVQLLVHDDEAEADVRDRLGDIIQAGKIQLHRIPQRDIWLRDSGPIFVRRDSRLEAVNWIFNGWGNRFPAQLDNQIPAHITAALKLEAESIHSPGIVLEGGGIEVNGEGLAITTRQCLLSPNRNPGLTEADLEQYLRAYLGIETLIWLEQGLEGDHTDGHVDTITRFVGPRQVVTTVCEDASDANCAPLRRNLQILQSWQDQRGEGLEVIPLPQPALELWFDGERLPLTYANFYIANGAVLMPTFDCTEDAKALQILRAQFTDREIIGLPARGLFNGGGGFHCATQQQPVGAIASSAPQKTHHGNPL